MNENSIWLLNPNLVWKGRSFDSSVLWAPRSNKKVYLNSSATSAIKKIDGVTTLGEIITAQSEKYNLSREKSAQDTLRLFERLSTDQLIVMNGEGKPIQLDTVTPHLDYITMALTYRCNLRCKHCFVDAGDARPNELKVEQWLKFIEQLPQFKLFEVILTGGEPLLYDGFWDVVYGLNNIQIPVSIFTNGLLIDDKFLERAKGSMINGFQISLDGVRAETHEWLRGKSESFDKTVNTIKRLCKLGYKVHIAVTVSRINYAEHPKFIEFCKELGATSVNFSEIVLNGRARTFADELALSASEIAQMRLYHGCKRITEHSIQVGEGLEPPDYAWDRFHPGQGAQRTMCSAAKDSCDLTPTGNVLACQALWWDELISGNIIHSSFKNIWESAPNMELFRQMNVDQFRVCQECECKYECGGGCRALAYMAYKDLYAPSDDLTCEWKKNFVRRYHQEILPFLRNKNWDGLKDFERTLEAPI